MSYSGLSEASQQVAKQPLGSLQLCGLFGLRLGEASSQLALGRDRLGLVGVPLAFKALSNTLDPIPPDFWNFGDGSTGRGRDVEHVYVLPGKYVVVLDATLPTTKPSQEPLCR